MSLHVRWRTYRFECPHPGCSCAQTQADHQRRDPSTMARGDCPTHEAMLRFAGSQPLYDPAAVQALISEMVVWLRHVDRLDEIPGAKLGLPARNPLWDAGTALELEFSARLAALGEMGDG